mgnify:CR=1 FL=1
MENSLKQQVGGDFQNKVWMGNFKVHLSSPGELSLQDNHCETCILSSGCKWERLEVAPDRFVLKFSTTRRRHLLISIQTLVSSPTMATSLAISFNFPRLSSNMQPPLYLSSVSTFQGPAYTLDSDLKFSEQGFVC